MTNLVEYVLNMKGNLPAGLAQADSQAKKLEGSLMSVRSAVTSLGAAIGVAFGVSEIVSFAKSVVETGSKIETLNNVVKFSSLNAADAAANHEFLKHMIQDYKLPLIETTEGFSQFSAALIGSSLQGEKTRQIFEGVSTAVTAMHLSGAQANQVFLALNQMVSKGTVQAQEMKLQLGNALPGAFQIAARSMGLTTAEFTKMMESGQVIASDFLPKFAAELQSQFKGAIPNAILSTQARLNEMRNSFIDLKDFIFTELQPVINSVIGTIAEFAKSIKTAFGNIRDFVKGINVDAQSWMVYVNEIKDLVVNYIWPYIQNIFYTTTGIARDIYQFVQHSTILKDQFRSLMEFAKVVFQIINYIVDAIKIVWEYGVKPIANAIENVYRWIKGINGTKVEAEISVSNANDWMNKITNKDQESKDTTSLIPGKNKALSNGNKPSETIAAPKTKAEGQKTINIHVAYNAPLIQGFTISTTNVKEGLESLKEKVSAILVGATHDTLMVADY